jgi:hypothetical protein
MIIQIKPLPPKDVATYIARRLQVAGYTGPALFSPEAVGMIAVRSRGIPRIINNYCFNSLSLAFATKSTSVDAEMVSEVAQDLELVDLFAEGIAAESTDIIPIELPVLAPEARAVVPIRASAHWLASEAAMNTGSVAPESMGIRDLRSAALPSYNVDTSKPPVKLTPRPVPRREASRPPSSLAIARRGVRSRSSRLDAVGREVGRQLRGISAFVIRLTGFEITRDRLPASSAKSRSRRSPEISPNKIAEQAGAGYRVEGANV